MTDTSVEDFLAHHGVLGMKWGHHKSGGGGSSSGSSKPAAKPSAKQLVDKANEVKATKAKVTSKDIKEARARQEARATQVNQHFIDVVNQTSDAGRARAQKILDKSADTYVHNPDAEVANRMTAGEKVTGAIGVALIGVTAASLFVK